MITGLVILGITEYWVASARLDSYSGRQYANAIAVSISFRLMSSEPTDHLQMESIRLSSAGVAEMDRHRAVIFVPREKITQLEVAFGSGAENPVVLLILGLVFLVVAAFPLLLFALILIQDRGKVHAEMLTAVAFVVPGWWLLDLALRKRWYVRVHMRSGTRKLVFHKLRDPAGIVAFMSEASRRFGYPFTGTAERIAPDL